MSKAEGGNESWKMTNQVMICFYRPVCVRGTTSINIIGEEQQG